MHFIKKIILLGAVVSASSAFAAPVLRNPRGRFWAIRRAQQRGEFVQLHLVSPEGKPIKPLRAMYLDVSGKNRKRKDPIISVAVGEGVPRNVPASLVRLWERSKAGPRVMR